MRRVRPTKKVKLLLRNKDGDVELVRGAVVDVVRRRYRIESIPTRVFTPKYGDIVVAKLNDDGALEFQRKFADGDFETTALVYSKASLFRRLVRWLAQSFGATAKRISAPKLFADGFLATGLIVVAVPKRIGFARMARSAERRFVGVQSLTREGSEQLKRLKQLVRLSSRWPSQGRGEKPSRF